MSIEALPPMMPIMDIGDRIKQFREAAGMSQSALAKKAGVSQPVIADLETKKQRSTKFIVQIARALDKKIEDIDPQFGEPPRAVRGQAQAQYKPPPLFFDPVNTMPIFSAAEGGDGYIIISSDTIEHLPRPYTLEGIPEAYGILIVGESMIPAFKPGETAWVNPRLPPQRDSEVILYELGDETGDARALIKELISWTATHWTVKQYNPEQVFKLERALWSRCHRVVGKFMRR